MEFKHLRDAVATQLAYMYKGVMLRVAFPLGPNGELLDQLYNLYLDSFLEGTNPVFRKQREYDCSCCKSFIRAVGHMVSWVDGKLVSVWDIKVPKEPGFQPVVDAMAAYIHALPISNPYTYFQAQAGQDRSVEMMEGKPHTWNHFSAILPGSVVKRNDDVGPYLSEKRSTFDLFFRAMTELKIDAIQTVLDLIGDKAIYKYAETKPVAEFLLKEKREFDALTTPRAKEIHCWVKAMTLPQALTRCGNTSFGELVYALSEGKDLEGAVKAYEAMVAPSNYKRPKALVTPAMIANAKETLARIGLASALERRFATLEDIATPNLLHVNHSVKRRVKGANVFDDMLAETSSKVRVTDKVEEVSIDTFIKDILPRVESMEALLENRHASNFVSLITADDPTAGRLFKWDNPFSWSYTGDVTDSVKERVKAAGGKVDGDVCFRLAWDYTDDLDLHLTEPGGYEIQFTNRRMASPCGGVLDLDANGADGQRSDPSENIVYADRRKMKPGMYSLWVHNFARRQPDKRGFTAQIEILGETFEFVYEKAVGNKEIVAIAQVEVGKDGTIKIVKSLPSTTATKMVWGLPTQTFHQVNVMMLSPNHWDGQQKGMLHYFFMLQGAANDGKARGFYNEFLRDDLNEHRKVFELAGAKMRFDGPAATEQLSGLGFSQTQKNSVTLRLKGSTTRLLKVNFSV